MKDLKPTIVLVIIVLLLCITIPTIGFTEAQKAEVEKLTLRIGRLPWGAINSQVTKMMLEKKLIEKYGNQLGYDLNVDMRDYSTAMPQIEAMLAGKQDIGIWGNVPIVRAIASKMPIHVLALGEGHLNFYICVRPDSDIRKMDDLRDKIVASYLGGDPWFAFSMIVGVHFGVEAPEDIGIRGINITSFPMLASMPKGVDATVLLTAWYLKGEYILKSLKSLCDSYGNTGTHYKGPLGEGPGIMVPSVKKSPFYPEGYYLHRTMWVATEEIIKTHPKAVQAYLMALQEATDLVSKMEPAEASDYVKEYWELESKLGKVIVEDDVVYKRGWTWLTRGDVMSLVAISKFMEGAGIIEEPISWEDVRQNLELIAPIMKEAYEKMGESPPMSTFLATEAEDLRGYPVWHIEEMKEK